ncbi:MAG: basic amino acid ABC transporter substrate-binding protein [Dehalococcoidales bacterium]|jgi:polar amino acid transport system substrate-binding protein|nr:basic amino acid ABC transporter substrate-binding protein [Dehalococcoidales bacterium]
MKRLLWLLMATVLVAGLLLPGCSGGDTGKIRVATDATWAPFEYVDTATDAIVGFDIDLFNAIAEKAGLEVEWVNVEWDPLLAGVSQGTYDAAISSITIKESRMAEMDFSDPYYIAGQIIVARTESAIAGVEDLPGKKVGVQSGTTGDDEASAIDGVDVTGYDEIGMAFAALMNKQIDAVVCDTPVASGYVNKYDTLKTVGEVLTTEEYGIAMPKGSDELKAKINKALAEVKAENIIDQLVEKWLVG